MTQFLEKIPDSKSYYTKHTGGHEMIILTILNKANVQSFLELGIYKGDCIMKAAQFIPNCVGVDIVDHIGPNKNFKFVNATTDDFFSSNTSKFDAIFIDAEHKLDVAIRDLENSLKVLNYNGFIFMHDTDPACKELVHPGYCGTAYGINEYVYKSHPELDMVTLPVTEAGITIIKRKNENRATSYFQ